FQAEDGIRGFHVTGVQTCALPIYDLFCPDCGRRAIFFCPALDSNADQYFGLACPLLYVEKMAHIILASSSPRRCELLQQLGLSFDFYSPDIDESVREGESVAASV